MAERHVNLYDLARWRRYRFVLLFAGTICALGAIVTTVRGQLPATSNNWLLVGVCSYSLALSIWLRARFSDVRVQGDTLVFRVLVARQRVDLGRIRRIRAAKLIGTFERPERRRYMPRPPRRWHDTQAVVIRLREPDDGKLRRLLGRRCVFEDEVVIPVVDAAGLCREVDAVIGPAPDIAADLGRRPGRRGRRRR